MYSLRYLSISHKLWLLTLFTAIGLIIASLLQLNEYRSGMMKEKETQIRVLIETAYSIASDLHTQVEKGSLDREQAQQRAAAQIKALRYDKTNYFWINTFDARIVMHPIKPELNGKDLSNFSDPAGKKIFSEFAALAKRDGEGVVPYLWEKPGKNKPVNKISFVKSFTPWGWVIGTGIYVDDVDEAYWKSALTQGITALVILGIMLALSIVITRSIVAPLKQTISALDDISLGEGDLTRRLDEAGRDEIMKLSVAFNRFSEKIRLIIIQVSQGSNQLATAAEELSSSSLQTHDNISLQQNETQQVATAVTEMAATVKEIAESADGAANSARSANEQAVKGKQVVVDVTEAITNLASEMNSTSEVINVLAKESESIGSVSDVIRGIAEQTSLLALNAAIEAARAGEQGRGFAVVADEVRSLASRTQQATTEIRDMIERLQSGTQNAVDVIHRSEQTTTATVQKADAAAESLDQIVSSVALISDRNIQIASAAEEQSAVAQEIDRSIVEISQLADHSALASEQITQATGELSQLSVSLRDIISNFKTG